MRSIRWSLLIYFLLLLTGALAGVSYFSYQTTAAALHQQKLDSEKLIRQQCETQIVGAKAALDKRLLRQAHALLNRSQSAFVHAEGLLNHCGIFGAASFPLAHATIPIWLDQNMNVGRAREIYGAQPLYTHLEIDDLVPFNPDHDPDHDYFQTYRRSGAPMQGSDSMEDHVFTLNDAQRQAAPFNELMDEADVGPVRVRRVTLKTPVQKYDVINIDRVVFSKVPTPQLFSKGPAKGANPPKGKIVWPTRPTFIPATVPTIFIQYASDLTPLQQKIDQIEAERDKQLTTLEQSMMRDLEQLRDRMLFISAITLIAIWLGGVGVIQLGLAPLAKMSDAVRKISPKNFNLPLDKSKLPNELQPIAATLKETLDHLQRAFAREKQSAADISHELRTPLAALMTTLEVALRKNRSADEYREILTECRASGQHMYQLVERIMTVARLDAGADKYRPEEVDVVEMALGVSDMIRPLAKAKGLSLRVQLGDPIITHTDPDKLRETLVNLLHNAIEYNKPDGSIDLAVERVGNRIRFQVRDTGIGIPPEGMEHIFERFYRGDPSRHADTPHAGLGLSIVKCYVELMGGTIGVQSSPAGTTFAIELPFLAPKLSDSTAIKVGSS